jgi:hypothetical protein
MKKVLALMVMVGSSLSLALGTIAVPKLVLITVAFDFLVPFAAPFTEEIIAFLLLAFAARLVSQGGSGNLVLA